MLQRISTFGLGIVCGLAVGAAFALVLTPDSGDGLRQQVRQHVQHALDEGAKAADERRQELRDQLGIKPTPQHEAQA